MSWDIYVQDLPPGIAAIADIPDDFRPNWRIGRAALIENIQAVVPAADFTNPTWGLIEGPGCSIEVNLGDDDPVEDFAFHVRGDGDAAAGVIADILDRLGLRGLDPQSETGLFDRESAVQSLRAWQAWRDSTMPKGQP